MAPPGRDPILAAVEAAVDDRLEPFLLDRGFIREVVERIPGSASWLFDRGWMRPTDGPRPLYAHLSVSVNPRDIPFFARMVLGEGPDHSPEDEWNGLALWRIAAAEAPPGITVDTDYSMESPQAASRTIDTILEHLDRHASGFLAGRPERFFELRRSINGPGPEMDQEAVFRAIEQGTPRVLRPLMRTWFRQQGPRR